MPIFCRHQISLDLPPLWKKTSHSRTSSYRACSETNVILPKCWGDKLNVKLSSYKLSVFTNDIFNVFQVLADEKQCEHECRGRETTALHSVRLSHDLKVADSMSKMYQVARTCESEESEGRNLFQCYKIWLVSPFHHLNANPLIHKVEL